MQECSYEVMLNTIQRVKSFAKMAESFDGDIYLMSGRYTIDGKSVLGIFSLDITKEIVCKIESTDEEVSLFEENLRKLNFLVSKA